MAKKSKKAPNRSLNNVLGALVMLIPAMLAAATAFMNTIVARDNGTLDSLLGDTKKKGRKKGKSGSAA
jgi:hypothetical protein